MALQLGRGRRDRRHLRHCSHRTRGHPNTQADADHSARADIYTNTYAAISHRDAHGSSRSTLYCRLIVLAVIIIGPWTALVPDMLGALGLSRDGKTVVLLLVPVVVILAYALTRTFRPVVPRDSRGPQGTVSPLSS